MNTKHSIFLKTSIEITGIPRNSRLRRLLGGLVGLQNIENY